MIALTRLPALACQVQLDEAGHLVWYERQGAGEVEYTTEPMASLWLRLSVGFLSLLPIEWLL